MLVSMKKIEIGRGIGSGINITTVVTPARGFRNHGGIHLVSPCHPAIDNSRGTKRAFVEKMLLYPIRKEQFVLVIHGHLLVQARGLVGIVYSRLVSSQDCVEIRLRRRRIVLVNRDAELGIPAEELVSGSGFPLPARIPVMAIPVIIPGEKIQQHIVREIRRIQVLKYTGVSRLRAEARIGEPHHRIPCRQVPVDRLRHVLGVKIFPATPVIFRHEGCTRALARVVHSPVQAVHVQVRIHPVRRGMSHFVLGIAHELIPHILGARALVPMPMGPGIIKMRTENDGIKLFRGSRTGGLVLEQLVLQFSGAVGPLEEQAEIMLGDIGIAARSAVDAQSAINLEAVSPIRVNQLDRGRTLPIHPGSRGIVVDPRRAKKVVHFGHDRNRRDTLQIVNNGIAIHVAEQIVHPDHVRVHFVIGRHPGPGTGPSRRTGGLVHHVRGKDIGLGVHIGRQPVLSEGRRPQQGRRIDGYGLGIDQSVRRTGRAGVQGIANLDPCGRAADRNDKRIAEKTAINGELGIGNNTYKTVPIGPTRGGCSKVTQSPGTGMSIRDIHRLLGVSRGVGLDHVPRRVDQAQVFPVPIELEARMVKARRIHVGIARLPRCKENQVAPGGDHNRGGRPLQAERIIRDHPARQVQGHPVGIIQLDPIAGIPIPVIQCAIIRRHELRDFRVEQHTVHRRLGVCETCADLVACREGEQGGFVDYNGRVAIRNNGPYARLDQDIKPIANRPTDIDKCTG